MDYYRFLRKKGLSVDINQLIVCEHTYFVPANTIKSHLSVTNTPNRHFPNKKDIIFPKYFVISYF